MPGYALAGLLIMAVSEAATLARLEPFYSWHTPIVWTGYILFADGLVRRATGSSWLTRHRREFIFLALVSIPLWLVFEAYNLLIANWHYINLPRNIAARYGGYAWAFATIWPGIFETADLVAAWRGRPSPRTPAPRRWAAGRSVHVVFVVAGAAMLAWPIIAPSPYLAAPVWLGFILLLDPLNELAGGESLLADLTGRGRRERPVNLALAGLACGFLWEFWNYWAFTKWKYTVPIMPDVRLFEMPLPGYLGFPAFALECFTMYVFVRRLIWRGPARPIGVYNPQ